MRKAATARPLRTAAAPAAVRDPLPRLSVAERDRRYGLIRRRMAAAKLDALILPANHARWDQMMADSRYATTIGGFGTETLTIFPREGEVTAYVFNRAGFWKKVQDWVTDVRDGRNYWADNAIERLTELKVGKGRIGISGLEGLIRAPDGLVPYTMVTRLQGAFPAATFVDATGIIQEVRSVKSAEEIALMRRSAWIGERMVDAMLASARPGANERHVYAEMTKALLDNGGDLPTLLIFASGPNLSHGQFVPSDRLMQAGDLLVNEMEAKYAGYGAQLVQPAVLGRPDKAYAALVAAAVECFDVVADAMRPGVTLGEVVAAYKGAVKKIGKGRYKYAHPLMHARGLGDEVPVLLGDDDVERLHTIPLKAGMCFVVKPRVGAASGGPTAQVGDTVVVTRSGAKRLGERALGLRVIE
ncbi:MAG: M24 family metallopeptidase [Rhodospirillales bacterium]